MKKIGAVAGASIAAFAVGATLAGGLTIATADSNSGFHPDHPAPGLRTRPDGWPHEPPRPGEIVTGEDAQKAIDAALAVVPGTADHVHKDASATLPRDGYDQRQHTHPRRALTPTSPS